MTKEQKQADIIIDSYHIALWDNGFPISKPMLKQCALIYVKGLIREINKYHYTDLSDICFWNDVIEIIKNK